jgi:hypothetical protein
MLAYGPFGSCACAGQHWPRTITSAKAPHAILVVVFWFIDSSLWELKNIIHTGMDVMNLKMDVMTLEALIEHPLATQP